MTTWNEGPMPVMETGTDTQLSPLYRVLIHNDDVTPMDIVVAILRVIFLLDGPRAKAVMMEAHNTGVALVCVEALEQAEFHVDQAHSLARGSKYPLTLTYEPEEGDGAGA